MPRRPRSAGPLSVVLFWRHPLVANGFRASLESESFLVRDFRLRSEEPPAEALEAIGTPEELVAVDSEDGSALRVLARLETAHPTARTLVLAESFEDERTSFRFLRAGVKGLVTYAEFPEQLAPALEAVAAGGFWVPRSLLSRFVEATVKSVPRPRPENRRTLTPREGEILEDLLQNLSNKEIAKRRHLTSRTVKFHVSNVLAKYGVKRRADLLLLSYSTQ